MNSTLAFTALFAPGLRGFLFLLFIAGATFPSSINAQSLPRADAYYLEFSLNGLRQPVFCGQLDSARSAPLCYAVNYDSLSRPVQVTRLFFGNLDSRGSWTIMKFRYDTLPRGSRLMRRTWHNPSGFPIPVGVAHGEDVLYDSTGALVMVTAIDQEGERVERVNAVTRSIYRRMQDGSYVQEWRYSNNKQYPGMEQDIWGTEFALLDRNAWFRKFRTDAQGHIIEELPWSLAKKPIPFPGGEMVRSYRRDSCGRLLSTHFNTLEGTLMVDSSGVAVINYEYDAGGRLVGWHSFDLQGKPKGRRELNGAAAMARAYRDFDGGLISETFYDVNGKEVTIPIIQPQIPQPAESDEWEGRE